MRTIIVLSLSLMSLSATAFAARKKPYIQCERKVENYHYVVNASLTTAWKKVAEDDMRADGKVTVARTTRNSIGKRVYEAEYHRHSEDRSISITLMLDDEIEGKISMNYDRKKITDAVLHLFASDRELDLKCEFLN